jgi:hypothetical protein
MNPQSGKSRRRARLMGWWYICIGLGFGLLGARNLLAHIALWNVLLHWVIAAGFFILGILMLR